MSYLPVSTQPGPPVTWKSCRPYACITMPFKVIFVPMYRPPARVPDRELISPEVLGLIEATSNAGGVVDCAATRGVTWNAGVNPATVARKDINTLCSVSML